MHARGNFYGCTALLKYTHLEVARLPNDTGKEYYTLFVCTKTMLSLDDIIPIMWYPEIPTYIAQVNF